MRALSCQLVLCSAVLLLGDAEAAKPKKKAAHSAAAATAPAGTVAIPLSAGGGSRIEDVAISGILGFTQDTTPRPGPALAALARDNGVSGAKAARNKLLGFSRDGEPAIVLYLEYASAADAQKALPRLRTKLWGGDQPPPEGPRLLRANNVIAAIESQTLTVALAVSKGLVTAGAVQDAADPSFNQAPEEGEASFGTTPDSGPTELNLPVPGAVSEDDQARIAAGMGKYLEPSAAAGKLLQDRRYADALVSYRAFDKDVSADPAAPDLARWDAAEGVGMAAAATKNMPEAKSAFQRAAKFATKVDAKKVAESYFNLACAEAELGNKGPAIADLLICLTVAKKVGLAAHYKESIAKDDSLKSLRPDPRVKKILAK